MRARSRMMQRTVTLGVLTLIGTLMSGCSGSDAAPTTNSAIDQAASATPDSSTVPPTASSDFPSCDEVRTALGAAVDGLIELDDSENGVSTGADGPELACSWFTPDTNGSSIDIAEYGGISIGVSRDPSYTEDSMEPLGWNVQDERVAAADAWALKVGGSYNPADQLDATGVQVIRNGVVVVFTSGGVALQDVPQLASLTNDWALGAGVAVLELVDQSS